MELRWRPVLPEVEQILFIIAGCAVFPDQGVVIGSAYVAQVLLSLLLQTPGALGGTELLRVDFVDRRDT